MSEIIEKNGMSTEDEEKRKPTSISMTDAEREEIEEYARLSGIRYFGPALLHAGLTYIRKEIPALRARHESRHE